MTKDLGRHVVKWGVQRRGEGYVAVVYLGESPVTDHVIMTKAEARAHARKRAASFRNFAGR